MQDMSEHDALHDRGRAIEEEYFRRKDRELIEKIRQKAAAEEAQRALGASIGVNDPEVLRELQALGFTPETIALLPLMPVLQVAWAEGGITPVERHLIEKLATARGITPGGAADAQLMDWLANRPTDDAFRGAARLTRALLESGSGVVADLTAESLVDYCEQVASASGGIFGLGRVSGDERQLLASIAADLKGRKA
jgi:hypothetical protein